MTVAVPALVRTLPRPRLTIRAPFRRIGVFGVWFIVYLAIGSYINLFIQAMHGDAYSRVTNASYVLFSRDPHLAAIGFVWSPLPSLFELPFLPLKLLWPPMVETGFAAIIMSSFFMAAAVDQVNRAAADFGVARFFRRALVVMFALHPMLLYYGAIGTAEAPTVFFLVVVVRQLARWIDTPVVAPLVLAGMALAGAYLTRYEAAISAAGAGAVVAAIVMARARGAWRQRITVAAAEAAILLAPFALAFVGWTMVSWIIVGEPFPQFSSVYGNSSQIKVLVAQGHNEFAMPLAQKMILAFERPTALYVVAVPAVVTALALAGWRRDWRIFAVLGVLAPSLGFVVFAYLTGTLAPWLRYFILVIPMAHLSLALIAGKRDRETPKPVIRPLARPSRAAQQVRGTLRHVIPTLAVVAALAALPVAALGVLDPRLAAEEARDVFGLLIGDARSMQRPGLGLTTFAAEAVIADYLDARQLPRGSVLLDAFVGFPIIGRSTHPQQFVITSDRDFQSVLADPAAFGVRYILAPDANGNGSLDAINRAYPDLALMPKGFVELERVFEPVGKSSRWSLYRVGGAAGDQ